ncbi:unnamed protein product [Cyclocybe aegerita]|uniref:Uncharacterized protein n=1 Tax=Cyclocybe aegerita TaxID=1973307 RepID=A0A8S0WCK4_CYCAE|nr:unnamed protein product [Cyclocybe aegerita]
MSSISSNTSSITSSACDTLTQRGLFYTNWLNGGHTIVCGNCSQIGSFAGTASPQTSDVDEDHMSSDADSPRIVTRSGPHATTTTINGPAVIGGIPTQTQPTNVHSHGPTVNVNPVFGVPSANLASSDSASGTASNTLTPDDSISTAPERARTGAGRAGTGGGRFSSHGPTVNINPVYAGGTGASRNNRSARSSPASSGPRTRGLQGIGITSSGVAGGASQNTRMSLAINAPQVLNFGQPNANSNTRPEVAVAQVSATLNQTPVATRPRLKERRSNALRSSKLFSVRLFVVFAFFFMLAMYFYISDRAARLARHSMPYFAPALPEEPENQWGLYYTRLVERLTLD